MKRRSSSRSCFFSHYFRVLLSSLVSRSNLCRIPVFIAVLLTGAAGQPAPQELDVAQVLVTGNVRTVETAVTNTFGLDEGRVHAYAEIRRGLQRIFEMGFYDDVRLYVDSIPAGHSLTIEVVERPAVAAIRISGNRKIGKGDIREKVQVGVGSSLDGRLVHQSLAAIRDLYKEKGYHLAEVSYDVETVSPTSANLILVIDEGVKVKIGTIEIEGNTSLSSRAIKKVMESKEKGWFAKKDYNPEQFDDDMERIVDLYRDRGFKEAAILSHRAEIDRDNASAHLTVTVDEGPQIIIRGVDVVVTDQIDSSGTVSDEVLAGRVALRAGEPYSQTDYEKTLENLYAALGDLGFIYARIEPSESIAKDSLQLTLHVSPERAVKVEKIMIEGNETTFEKVIRREMVIKPGDTLRRSLIERSHREVFNLGFFEDVEVGSNLANEEGDIDLVFKVKERQTGIANVGAGYSEEFGLTGFLEFSHNNVGWFRRFPYLGLGKGQTINLRWEFGKLTQIELSYRNPWFRDTPMLVGFDIYDTRREYETYTDKRDGLGFIVGRRIPYIDYSSIYLRYRLERREIEPDQGKASELVKSQAGKRTTSSTTVTFLRNSVDNPFFPRGGSRTSLTAEWAGGPLGGNTAYQSYILESSSFMAMPMWNSALVFRVRASVVDGLGGEPYIPVYERFRLGGTTSEGIRGYGDREIVPEGNEIDDGGRFMVTGSIEYRIPVVKNRAHALLFADAGDTWNSVRAARPGFLRRSVGVGFRIEIPMMGQIGLDIGYGFDREDRFGGPGWETHFQFGTAGY